MYARHLLATCAMVAITLFFVQDKQEKQTAPATQDKIVIPGQGEDAVSRRDFMRSKLMYSQNIMHGLTVGRFKMIDSGIENLSQVTEASKWVEVDDDRYRKLTEDFNTSVARLKEAAKSRNIEAIALRYYQVSTSCIDCHQHIRIANYEF